MAIISKFSLNGNANDLAGSNSLTVSGATSETYGGINGSYSFASGNYMNKNSATGFPAGGTADLTYEFRAKWSTGGLASAAFDWICTLADGSGNYALGFVTTATTNSNQVELAQNDGAFTASSVGNVKNDGKWHNYVCTRQSSGTILRLWEDGKMIINSSGLTARSVVVNRITMNGNSGNPPVNGITQTHSIDEIIIRNSVPSDADIVNQNAFYKGFI